MAGMMNLRVGAGLNAMNSSPSQSATVSAYGPSAASAPGVATAPASILNPTHGHGLGFWLRVGVIGVAVIMYWGAPK